MFCKVVGLEDRNAPKIDLLRCFLAVAVAEAVEALLLVDSGREAVRKKKGGNIIWLDHKRAMKSSKARVRDFGARLIN